MVVPWWEFSRLCFHLRTILELASAGAPPEVRVNDELRTAITRLREDSDILARAEAAHPVPEDELQARLRDLGFRRTLTACQLRNVSRLAALPHGATFSVPGAGKTTEALALYAYRTQLQQNLLVACPKNAFAAWDEQIAECLPMLSATRLSGGADGVARALAANPRIALIGYQQLVTAVEPVAQYLTSSPTGMVLDESHKIKRGDAGVWGTTVLNLSCLPSWRLIMSGTPMPNSDGDLLPQLRFLVPGLNPDSQRRPIPELIRPLYVRTSKRELGLPPVESSGVHVPMTPPQRLLYKLCADESIRQLVPALRARDRSVLRRAGRCYQILLQLVSNPALLLDGNHGLPEPLLHAAIAAGAPKVDWVCRRARELASQGSKVLIWTNFISNVQTIAARLADLEAQSIFGAVPTGSEDDDETREGKIRRFKTDANCYALVANPQACAEAISLHMQCHHAIYVDRTYNAAQYLQSQDRIHRIGLPPDQLTYIEVLSSPDSIDVSVERRLDRKIQRMRQVLNDNSIGLDIYWSETEDDDFDLDDAADLLQLLQQA
jgi:SNF2 family DNA or RNA helicase